MRGGVAALPRGRASPCNGHDDTRCAAMRCDARPCIATHRRRGDDDDTDARRRDDGYVAIHRNALSCIAVA
jgi:hypothetical protein